MNQEIEEYESFSELPQQDVNANSVFNSLDWYHLFENTVTPLQGKIKIYSQRYDNNDCEKLTLPCFEAVDKKRFIAISGLKSLANYYSPLFSPFPDYASPAAMRQFLRKVIENVNTDIIELGPLDPESSFCVAYKLALTNLGWSWRQEPAFTNWYHCVDGSYDEYFRLRPGKVRSTCQRRLKKFNQIANSRIEIVTSDSSIERYIKDYLTVYEKSWKPIEAYSEFVPGLIRLLATRGELRLGFAYVGDTPIAVHLWSVENSCASIFKLSYNSDFAKYSPGTVLMCEMLKHVIDIDGVQEIDFLSGDDNYKKDWMSDHRERVVLTGYRPDSIVARVYLAQSMVKKRLKSLLDRNAA